MSIKLKDGTLLSDSLIIEILRENPSVLLKLIEDPTEEMCLTAVKNKPMALYFVKNKSLNVCLEAAKQFKISQKNKDRIQSGTAYEKFSWLIKIVEFTDLDDCIEKLENKMKLEGLIL